MYFLIPLGMVMELPAQGQVCLEARAYHLQSAILLGLFLLHGDGSVCNSSCSIHLGD